MALLEGKELSKTYKLGKIQVKALREVSIKLEEGDFLIIAGPSGSGKILY